MITENGWTDPSIPPFLITSTLKIEILKRYWKPLPSYVFVEDAKNSWLEKYSLWLEYFTHLNIALCVHCVTTSVQEFGLLHC